MKAVKIRGGLTPSKGVRPLLVFVVLLLSPAAVFSADDLVSIQTSFLRGEFEDVVKKAQHLLADPNANGRDDLLYLQGVSALKVGDVELARSALGRIAQEHPKSPWFLRANELLRTEDFIFSVQAGAFEAKANALRLKSELARRGYEVFVSDATSQGRRLYRVRVGRFDRREEAEKEAERLRADGFPTRVFP